MTTNSKKLSHYICFSAFFIALILFAFPAHSCATFSSKLAELSHCVLCPLFKVILKTDQTMATKSYAALASSFRNLVLMVMGLYIAYQTLMTVSAFTKQDAPKYISTLLMQGFKVFLTALLLTESKYIYDNLINPLMTAGLEFGLALLFDKELLSRFESMSASEGNSIPKGVIGSNVLGGVLAAVRLFSEASARLPAMGSILMCSSFESPAAYLGIIPKFGMLIQGLVIYGFGWAISLSCCFYLLDSAVRFGIFCTLLPFLIACWPFKITVSYTKKGWDMFMNCFFNFVMMGLIISLTVELISQSLGTGECDYDCIVRYMNNNNVGGLESVMEITGVNFLVLIACCMFAFKISSQVNALASEISGTSGGTPIGDQIGGAAASAVKGAAGLAGKAGAAVGGAVYEGTGAKAAVQSKKDQAMAGLAKAGAKIGLGPKANPNGAGGGK